MRVCADASVQKSSRTHKSTENTLNIVTKFPFHFVYICAPNGGSTFFGYAQHIFNGHFIGNSLRIIFIFFCFCFFRYIFSFHGAFAGCYSLFVVELLRDVQIEKKNECNSLHTIVDAADLLLLWSRISINRKTIL